MTMHAITPEQRYSRTHPCPICGGVMSGKSPHCHGFLSGDFAHCSKDHGDGAMLIEKGIKPVYKYRRNPNGVGYRPWKAEPPNNYESAPKPRLVRLHPDQAEPAPEPIAKALRDKPAVQYFHYGPTQRIERMNSFDDGKWTKECRSQHMREGGWAYGDGPDEKEYIYDRDSIAEQPGKPLHILEGENCCEAARKLGYRAITWRGGTGRVADAIDQIKAVCAGEQVILWPDADQPGRKAMKQIAEAIRSVASRVRVMDLFPDDNPVKDGRDIEDCLAEGCTADIFTAWISEAPDYEYEPEEIRDETAPRIYPTYTAKEMKDRPAITFAVQNLIPEGSLASLVGAPATYKSFIALDIAASIATREYWQDRDVLPGGALYISAEGASGMGQRIRAWEAARNLEIPDTFRVITDAPQLCDPDDLAALLATAEGVTQEIAAPLRLIVIDTLARTFNGEENSSKEMGEAIAAADALRRATGAAVLIVHHLNKAGTGSRGSSALLGALDAEITVTRSEHTVTMGVTKAKDFGEGEPIMLAARVVALDGGASSITLDKATPSADGFKAEWKNVGLVLHDQFGEIGAPQSAWKKACCDDKTFPESTFNRARTALADKNYIISPAAGKPSRGHIYRLTREFYDDFGMDIPWWLDKNDSTCGPASA